MRARSFSRADVVGAVLGVLVLATLVCAQVDDRSRELANRAVCAANLRGIAQSMCVYAADNDDMYPFLVPSSATTYDVTFKGRRAGRTRIRLWNPCTRRRSIRTIPAPTCGSW